MPSIIYRTQNGSTYAYRNVSYWSKEKKAPRTRRTYLGKVDEETGEIIRVYKKAGKNGGDAPQSAPDETFTATQFEEDYPRVVAEVERLTKENAQLRDENLALKAKFQAMREIFESVS